MLDYNIFIYIIVLAIQKLHGLVDLMKGRVYTTQSSIWKMKKSTPSNSMSVFNQEVTPSSCDFLSTVMNI